MAITITQSEDVLNTAFYAGWGSTTPIAWGNVPFTPPDSNSWVRFTVRVGDSDQTSLGPEGCRRFQRNGRVFVQIFTFEAEQGTTLGTALVDSVLSIMEGKNFSSIYTLAADVTGIGPDGKWYQTNVSIPFWYHAIK